MSGKVTWRQRIGVRSLLTNGTILAASAAAGVTRRTFHRWLKLPTFQAALREAEAEAVDRVSRRLVQLADDAADTLEAAMADGESDNVKVRAASVVLANLSRLRQLETLERRLCALEEARYGKS